MDSGGLIDAETGVPVPVFPDANGYLWIGERRTYFGESPAQRARRIEQKRERERRARLQPERDLLADALPF